MQFGHIAKAPSEADAAFSRLTMESHGFEVRRVFPTHLWSVFEVPGSGVMKNTFEGEADFRTLTPETASATSCAAAMSKKQPSFGEGNFTRNSMRLLMYTRALEDNS